uniref:Uncharacterized protein n=1 Tax=Panagrolaimus sp. JU765 TaxID=591449 RepID=A0AC34Q834_9BILA
MARRVKQEVVTGDDIKVLYPVKSRPPSAPPNKDDSEDDKYVKVYDGPKVCRIPLKNNQIELNDLLLFFAGVDGLKSTVENGIPEILRLVKGCFKPPSTGWESGKVEVARRNIPNTIDTNSIVNQRSEGGSLPDSRYSSPLMPSAQDYTGQSEHWIRANRSEEASPFAGYPVISGSVLFDAPVQNMLPDPPLPVHSHVF